RLDAGALEPAGFVAARRTEGSGIDLETKNRSRKDQRVGAGRPRRLADRAHVAGIGRELAPDRLVRGLANEAHDVERVFLVQREIAAFRVARGAGDVDFEDIDRGFAD